MFVFQILNLLSTIDFQNSNLLAIFFGEGIVVLLVIILATNEWSIKKSFRQL
jgi:hypothetical protein